MTRLGIAVTALALLASVATATDAAGARRVKVTGEIIDSWCYVSEIMFARGTAHHLCALWCAAGGIPVGILGDDGHVYFVLKVGRDATSVASPAMLTIQSHTVTAEGDLWERDGMRYLLVNRIVHDRGIVNLTHEKYPIQPFGQ